LIPITPDKVASLFQPLDYNLSIGSVLAGLTPARIYADDPDKPTLALLAYNHNLVLGGSPQDATLIQSLNHLITGTIIPENLTADIGVIYLHTSSSAWLPFIDDILAGLYPVKRQRTYLECTHLLQDWRPLLSHEFTLRPVDPDLLSQSDLENMDYLKEELCSERLTIEDFLEKSFGFCILKGEQLASWCLSEYNTGDRCEVGVATVDAFQRQGLATVTTLALIEHAFSLAYRRVGWHSWSNNIPSLALAASTGFKEVHQYSVYVCVMDLAIQFALHGDDHRSLGAFQEALTWYKKAISFDNAPGWVFYNTARCLAHMGEIQAAIDHLQQAIARGFDDLDQMRTETDLSPLHADKAWESLFH
jgi:RimJ/RimL family protein N-acetyltransferase